LSNICLGVVGVGSFLQEQVHHRTPESVVWGFVFEDGFEVAVFGADSTEEVEDLLGSETG
jgi:hypothetical protein